MGDTLHTPAALAPGKR